MRSRMKDGGDDHWSMTDADAALRAACHPRSESDAFRIRGEPVILAFHPADWSPACDDQMTLNNEILSRCSASTPRDYWAFRSRGCGTVPPSLVTVGCICRCSAI